MKGTKFSNAKSCWIASFLCVGFLAGCAEEEVVEERPLRPVKSMIVTGSDDSIRERVFSGTAHSAEEADLSFKVSGTISKVHADVGDELKAGALVAELDKETYRVSLEQAKASAARSKATLRSSEAEYNRVRQLYTNDNASLNELDNALADSESAKASHNADLQAVQLAQLNLDYTKLTIGADCKVASVAVETNENISIGQTIAEVSCGDSWEVKMAVPESLIALFERNMEGEVEFPSLPGETFKAVVTEIGVGTGESATFPVTLLLNSTPKSIRSNLAAEVTLRLGTEASSEGDGEKFFYIPASAVSKDENGTYVYIIQKTDSPESDKVLRRSVNVGEVSELGIELIDGIKAGERIMVAGQINARDGMLVRAN